VQPMTAQTRSSLFGDSARFPSGNCTADCALLMRDTPAQWAAAGQLTASPARPLAAGMFLPAVTTRRSSLATTRRYRRSGT
jgi:hypothetical protein